MRNSDLPSTETVVVINNSDYSGSCCAAFMYIICTKNIFQLLRLSTKSAAADTIIPSIVIVRIYLLKNFPVD